MAKTKAPKPINDRSDLTPDPNNANDGTARGRALVQDSLSRFGAGRSILVDRNGVTLAGNKTLEAAEEIDLPIRVVQTDGHELVVVQRTDLDLETDPAARLLAYMDNRASEVGLAWSIPQIEADIVERGLELAPVFTARDIAVLFKGRLPGSPDIADVDISLSAEKLAEVREKWQTEPGQLWALGRHRLACSDCTDPEAVARLLAGATPRVCVTDPPYGVEYDPSWRRRVINSQTGRPVTTKGASQGQVVADNRADWREAWALFPGDVIYAWHGGLHTVPAAESLAASGFEIRAQLIWVKDHKVIGRGAYHWQHEPCFYAVRKGKNAGWCGDRKQATVWMIRNNDGTNPDAEALTGHGTQKPLECMLRPLANHEGDLYEPFCGSGTGILAAEALGRTCWASEIAPEYVAATLERFMLATGTKPVLTG